MKTLKEVYESIGEVLNVGDEMGKHFKIMWVDGWYFDDQHPVPGNSAVFDSSRFPFTDSLLPIKRNGKQIYPKVEEAPWNLGIYSKEQKEAWSNLEASLRQFKERNEFGDSAILANTIFAMINAKIKELKNEKN